MDIQDMRIFARVAAVQNLGGDPDTVFMNPVTFGTLSKQMEGKWTITSAAGFDGKKVAGIGFSGFKVNLNGTDLTIYLICSAMRTAARSLDPKPRDFRTAEFLYVATGEGSLPSDADLKGTIRNGVVSRGMPAWNGMQEADLDALVSYIKTFSPRWQPDADPSKPQT